MAPSRYARVLAQIILCIVVGLSLVVSGGAPVGGEEKAASKAREYLREGVEALRKGRLPEAAEAFERVTTLDPTNPIAHNNLGLTYMRLGRTRDAITAFEEAVALRPTSATFHYNLARACHLAKNYPKAIEHYEKTAALKPDHALAHLHLGKLYGREQERYPEAIEELKKAIALNAAKSEASYLPEAHYLLAVAYFGVKNFTLAWQSVKEAERRGYKVNPAFIKALRQMAPEPQ